jgi:uncharacterized iron-regulated protein
VQAAYRASESIAKARSALVLALAVVCGACATTGGRHHDDFVGRLHGDAVVLLGEVHDNAEVHERRLALLRSAFAAGWRPAIAMEQFDREHQPDIERARREKPHDAQHVIELAAPRGGSGGWNWEWYRPFVALALEYDVPLLAANLSRADAAKIVESGYGAVLDSRTIASLGLDRPVAPELEAAQRHEIDVGHCHDMPQSMLAGMARAQFARDAVMAAVLREHASEGIVLLAGNGHARRDIGVPRWLPSAWLTRVFSVGYLEKGDSVPRGAFDAVVLTPPAERTPPCADLDSRTHRST